MAFMPASCSKLTGKAGAGTKPTPAMVAAANATNAAAAQAAIAESDSKTRDLGELSMTNHYEVLVTVGKGATCLIVPRILDRKNLQLTLSLQEKNASGKVLGVNMAQVTGTMGKPIEVALGDMDLTLTPVIVGD